jgi:hypothetical protein
MSMPGHSASHSGGSKHDAPGPHNCTCLGACCCAPSVAVPSAQVAELTEAVVVDAAAPLLVREHQAPVAAPRYAHPFANGPPALANA